MMTRHEFLAELHKLLKPQTYLEIGVQYGTSLNLAAPDTLAIGIDPHPQCSPKDAQIIFSMTSQEYFKTLAPANAYLDIDLAFIDGQHLIEDVVHDYLQVVEYSHGRTVVVLDDVLPTTQAMAARTQCPGDWTGDVWKIEPWIALHYPSTQRILVNTFPTGLLVCWKVNRFSIQSSPLFDFPDTEEVPESVLKREFAREADDVLEEIRRWWTSR